MAGEHNHDQDEEKSDQVVENEGITIIPRKRTKKYTLAELLGQCTPDGAHKEIDFGTEGNELI